MPREKRRQREQKAASFAVRSGAARLAARRLEQEEAATFFRAIDAKDSAGFGIRKLSGLEVDGLHASPETVPWESRITLLYYAAWRRRDHFVAALLRAGADPGLREGGAEEEPEAKADARRRFVAALRPELAIWFVRALVRLRLAGARLKTEATTTSALGACKCGRSSQELRHPLAWDDCGHSCCEPCLWEVLCQLGTEGATLPCLTCGACARDVGGADPLESKRSSVVEQARLSQAAPRLDGEVCGRCGSTSNRCGCGDWQCTRCRYSNFAKRGDCRNCGASRTRGEADALAALAAPAGEADSQRQHGSEVDSAAAARGRREESLRRFLELPFSKPELSADQERSRRRLRALGAEAAARLRLGHTRAERTEELHKAAAVGDRARLEALLDAGVDINVADEYGQTPLYLAASRGFDSAVNVLGQAGADAEIVANGGCTPVIAAAVVGHGSTVEVLMALGADLERLGSGGLSARQYLEARSNAGDARQLPGLPYETLREGSSQSKPEVTWLIDASSAHAGAGSCFVDNAFEEDFLLRLERLFEKLPIAERSKASSNDRSYYSDSEGWVRAGFRKALQLCSHPPCREIMGLMRFLVYSEPGGGLPPHVDLARTDQDGRRSTHTFLLYLSDCSHGGETVLLEKADDAHSALARVRPERGRLLLFPHQCPHLAVETVDVPKVLVRGEAF